MYAHASVGKKSLGETVTVFSLARYLKAPNVVLIDIWRAFSRDRESTYLPTTELLLQAATENLAISKMLQYWTSSNSVLLPPFLTEAVTNDG